MSSALSSPATIADPRARAAIGTSTRAFLVLIAAVVSLAMQLKFIPIVGMGPGFEAVSIARSLAAHATFADPFDEPTGPTAHLAPLYPVLLAGIHRLTADEEYFRVATLCLTLLAHLLNVWLLFLLAGELFGDSKRRLIALSLVLAVPLYQVIPAWEAIYVSCGVLGFWLLARRRRVVIAGLFGGLLLLLNPSLAAILFPIVFCEWKRAKLVSAFLVIVLLVIAPWELRNYRVFHKLFFIRDNLGLELDVYNNDCEAYASGSCIPHPVASAAERSSIRDMGETTYNDVRMRRAVTWLETHPAAALRLMAQRLTAFWFPISTHTPYGWCISLLTMASLWGFWCLWRDRVPALWPMLAISVLYPIVYYLVRFDLRYRYPVLWISVLAAAYGMSRCMRHALHHRNGATARIPTQCRPSTPKIRYIG